MISHDHRVIFIHVPKTAGTSIEAAFGHHRDADVVRGSQDHRSLRQLQWPHGGAGQFRSMDNAREAARAIKGRVRRPEYPANRLLVSRAQYDAYFKFAVIRNPWARTYSWYRNVLPDPLHRRRLGVGADTTFAAFVVNHAGTDLLRPQTHWLTDFTGRIGVDFLCRFESLERDFADVCLRVGLPATPLPRLNQGGAGSYLHAYDDRTRRVVAERYRDEIDAFGYTFDGSREP